MAYATLDDLYQTYTGGEVKKLLPDKEDPRPLIRALENASSEIDGYINKRYKTPLKTVPAIINEWTCTIAFYKRSLEYGKSLTEERRKRYEDIFRYLTDINNGKATIPELENKEGGTEAPKGKGQIKLIQDRRSRLFSRRTMEGL